MGYPGGVRSRTDPTGIMSYGLPPAVVVKLHCVCRHFDRMDDRQPGNAVWIGGGMGIPDGGYGRQIPQ